jgi:quinol monooxygenase YgiN
MSDATRLIVAGSFRASKGVTHAVMKAMEAMATASRAEDGCETYSYARDVFDPTLIRVFEIWRDEACFQAHRRAAHLIAWRAKWVDLGLGEAALKTYQIAEEADI